MTTTTPVAGWYPDPLGSEDHRYWDGSAWTEHTHAPAAAPVQPQQQAPQLPVQQVPAQQTQVQQAPQIQGQQIYGQQVPGHQMPGQQIPGQQIPGQQIYGQQVPGRQMPGQQMPAQPYLYRPGARPAQVARPGYGYQRPRGRSTAATVLIGVAIAVGVLFVIGILAAIAIPVFLNQRAKAVVPPTSSGTTTVTIPETVAGLTLSHSASTQQLIQQLMSLQVPGQKSAGVYDDETGRKEAMVWVSKYHFSPAAQASFFKEAEAGVTGNGIGAFHRTAPGPLGGEMQCAPVTNATVTATVCLFVDAEVGGVVDVFGTTTGDALAVQLRQAVEHRS